MGLGMGWGSHGPTLAIIHMLHRVLPCQVIGHTTNEPFRPFGGRVDGDELEGSFGRFHLLLVSLASSQQSLYEGPLKHKRRAIRHPTTLTSTNPLTNVPTPGKTSTPKTSPSTNHSCGLRANPTPAGVPVNMTVPGINVVPPLRKLTSSPTPKIKSSHPHSCFTIPFLHPLMRNSLASGIRLVDATAGPSGHAQSKDLEWLHWLVANWDSRWEMSFAAV